jgi:DNA polymerase III epsilon subunit-like protein
MSYITFFDTETTGLPKRRNSNALESSDNWPEIVSIAWAVYEQDGTLVKKCYSIVKPEGWIIPDVVIKIHGITNEKAHTEGRALSDVLGELKADLEKSDRVVAHNIEFDKNVLFHAYKWHLNQNPLHIWPKCEICTMAKGVSETKIPSKFPTSNSPYKPPSLTELYKDTFDGREPTGQHNSLKDVEIISEIYWARWPKDHL